MVRQGRKGRRREEKEEEEEDGEDGQRDRERVKEEKVEGICLAREKKKSIKGKKIRKSGGFARRRRVPLWIPRVLDFPLSH